MIRERFGERLPIRDVFHVEVLPVVESGAAEPSLIEPKSGRTDDPEFGPDGDARATNVSRVLRDLGLVQDDVQRARTGGIVALQGGVVGLQGGVGA